MSYYFVRNLGSGRFRILSGSIPDRKTELRRILSRQTGITARRGSRSAGGLDRGANGVEHISLREGIHRHTTAQLHRSFEKVDSLILDKWVRYASSEEVGNQGIQAVQNWLIHSTAAAYHILNQGNYRENDVLQEYVLDVIEGMSRYENGVRGIYGRYLLMISSAFNATRTNWANVSIEPRAQIYVDWLNWIGGTAVVETRAIDGEFRQLRTFTIPRRFNPHRADMITPV